MNEFLDFTLDRFRALVAFYRDASKAWGCGAHMDCEAAAEAVMDASGHTKLETVLKHYGRMKRQDSLRLLREARQAHIAEVRKR